MRIKIIPLVLNFLLVFINAFSVFATTDTTPPVINSITINKNSLYGGDSIIYSINATDDLSGVENLMIEYKLKSNPAKHISIEAHNNSNSNNYSYSYLVPIGIDFGLWESYVIQFWDSAGNGRTYWKTNSEDNAIIQFSNLDFTILENPNFDTTPPILNSISVKNKVISAPGLIEITANASDNKSTNLHIGVTYLIRGEQHAITLTKTNGTTYTGSLPVDENAKYATATFAYAVIDDEAGNQVWYSYNPSQYPFGDESRLLTNNIDISFSNALTDIQAPVLNSYSYSKDTVTVPGSLDIIINASDDISGIAAIKVYFSGKDESGKLVDSWISPAQYNSTRKAYISKFSFNQYTPNSTYSVTLINLTDGAGNTVNYSINPQGSDKSIDQKFVTVIKGIESDLETGTMNDNYSQSIKDTQDGSLVSIDCTKNSIVNKDAFDSIRDTSKKILLINDGIQWLFDGKDIINPSKDINTKINIYTFDEYGNQHLLNNFEQSTNGIVIEFQSNGLLPGKALIRIKADYSFRNYIGEKDLYVYYFDESSNGLEAIANKIIISSEGYYEFYITHNSKYIISSKKASYVVKDSSEINIAYNTETVAQEDIKISDTKQENTSSTDKETKKQNSFSIINENPYLFVFLGILFSSVIITIIILRKSIVAFIKKHFASLKELFKRKIPQEK